MAQTQARDEAQQVVKQSRTMPAPLSPSAFAAVLKEKAFADGSDCASIAGLYRAVLEDGSRGRSQGEGLCRRQRLRLDRRAVSCGSGGRIWRSGRAAAERVWVGRRRCADLC